jgi:serine phosphatase RsbU (regulator of sigma subunit)/tetratricopeptide (TPR) repeat protein
MLIIKTIFPDNQKQVMFVFCLGLLCIGGKMKAQPLHFQNKDSMEVVRNNVRVQQFYFKNKYDEAIDLAQRNIKISESNSYEKEKAKGLLFLGKALREKKSYFESLKTLLKAQRSYENLYDESATAEVIIEIAILFQQQKAYLKANEHFKIAYNIYKKGYQTEKANRVLEYLAKIDFLLGNKESAYKSFVTLLDAKKEAGDLAQTIYFLNQLVEIDVENGNFKSAAQRYLELAKLYENPLQVASLSAVYNNLGFTYKRMNNMLQSVEYFNKSLSLYEKNKEKLSDSISVIFLENIGVAYTNLKAHKKADEFFNNSLKINQQRGNKAEIAKSYNYLAANHYISGNQIKALDAVNQAIINANSEDSEEVLMTSYRILELLYKNDDDNLSQKYGKQAERLRLNLNKKRGVESQKIMDGNVYLENLEDELKQQIVTDEQNSSRFRRLTEETDRQARESEKRKDSIQLQMKEIEILRGEQKIRSIAYNNKLLENEKAQQLLALLRQKSNYEQQRLRLKNTELQMQSQKEQEVRNRELIAEQAREIDNANRLQKYGLTIIVLGTLFFFGVGTGLYVTYRKNKELFMRNETIAKQSLSITQQNEELEAQQRYIEEKNKILALQNNKINESIRAAQTIQQAILPKENFLSSVFSDFFVLYLPKDVVSGDFYWIEQVGRQTIIAAVDCTGHGVSGAFMSMIGNSLLDKITETLPILEPNLILDMLDQEVKHTLNQEHNAGNEVGMDMALCVIDRDIEHGDFFRILFAGAGQSMYYLVPQIGKLEEVKGESKSIGIVSRKKADFKYTKKELFLHKGSSIYLSSDGFPDQNNPEKNKIGTTKLKELFFENAGFEMYEQKQILSNFLLGFQKGEPQRDDITVVGIRL